MKLPPVQFGSRTEPVAGVVCVPEEKVERPLRRSETPGTPGQRNRTPVQRQKIRLNFNQKKISTEPVVKEIRGWGSREELGIEELVHEWPDELA